MSRALALGVAVAVISTAAGCSSRHHTAASPPPPSPACSGTAGSSTTQTMDIGKHSRTFIEHLPTGFSAGTRYTAVIAFPGRGETAAQFQGYSHLDSANAIVLYAQGLDGTDGKPSWEATPYVEASAHDYDFASAMVTWLASAPCVDPSRIDMTGKSDGAGFAASAACATTGVAAVATVSGAFYEADNRCTPTGRPLPIMNMHGEADPVIPYGGNAKRGLDSTDAWLGVWRQRDSCTGPGTSAPAGSDVVAATWTSCTDGTEVVNYTVTDGGHTWPGATTDSGPGVTTHAIDATQLITSFFASHPLRTAG